MPAHCSQDAIFDHERDLRKHEPRPGDKDFPLRLEPKPLTTALEVAVLCQALGIRQAADLIEQYARTAHAEGLLEGVAKAYNRIDAALTKEGV